MTTTPKVFNRKDKFVHKDAVYIGRGSPWGNPFRIGRDGTRDEVCDKYEAMVLADEDYIRTVKAALKGKHLVCYCAPERCHGDFLLRIANED